jgi:hypothetical protein
MRSVKALVLQPLLKGEGLFDLSAVGSYRAVNVFRRLTNLFVIEIVV